VLACQFSRVITLLEDHSPLQRKSFYTPSESTSDDKDEKDSYAEADFINALSQLKNNVFSDN